MILPIGDQPNPRGAPIVNYLLIGANVAVFLLVALPLSLQGPDLSDPAVQELLRELVRQRRDLPAERVLAQALQQITAYDVFLMRWGYRAADPSVLTLLTSMFLHGGWLHLIGNMLFLWIYGDNVEHRLGPLWYLLAYLATGVAAALAYGALLSQAAGGVPMVGASGAISGVLGFYFIWFPRNKVRLLVVLFPFFFDVWLVNARIVLGFYLLVENLLPFVLRPSEGGGVAYGAHIGGFVAGLAGALLVDLVGNLRCRLAARDCLQNEAPSLPPAKRDEEGAEAVLAAHERGELEEATVRYLELPQPERRLVAAGVVADLAAARSAQGAHDAALSLYRRALLDHPRGPDLDRIFLGIGLVLLHGKGRPAAAYQYLMDALDAGPSPEVAEAVEDALETIARLQKHQLRSRRPPD